MAFFESIRKVASGIGDGVKGLGNILSASSDYSKVIENDIHTEIIVSEETQKYEIAMRIADKREEAYKTLAKHEVHMNKFKNNTDKAIIKSIDRQFSAANKLALAKRES